MSLFWVVFIYYYDFKIIFQKEIQWLLNDLSLVGIHNILYFFYG